MSWRPAPKEAVEKKLADGMSKLHPHHRALFESIRVSPRPIPVESDPGQFVFVVGEHNGRVLYWSDIEEGWELEEPNVKGGINTRGCNQFELSHIMYQTFGDPNA